MTEVAIVGVGIHPFGRHDGVSGREQGAHAARQALAHAGIGWGGVQFAFGGSAAAGNADALVADLGLTGIEFVNVINGCATGGSSLAMADRAIRSGDYDVGIAIGFDKHPPGAFNADPASYGLGEWYGETGLMLTTQFFGIKAQRYLHDHDIDPAVLSAIAAKAYRNGALNPNAWRRRPMSVEEIESSDMLSKPLTKYMFCSPAEGAVALVLCRAELASRFTDRPVYLKSCVMRSRAYGTFEVFSPSLSPDRTDGPTVQAAREAFEQAGVEPSDVDVAQVQDTEAGAELMHMAETGLCEHGEQVDLIMSGATEINGRLPINTDGGCIANGEPIGASGLRQVHEIVVQLRGEAGDRQVPNDPQVGFTHVYGAPGISACTVLAR
ncbi:thiolase family protein [Desertimonas flava]|uniref:thiolase family protein n=1 Tax=Desertimonas flava TaxID=2064846 RepID=UPI000E3520E1|nr:thiolase family protein [Desertimonas flava]